MRGSTSTLASSPEELVKEATAMHRHLEVRMEELRKMAARSKASSYSAASSSSGGGYNSPLAYGKSTGNTTSEDSMSQQAQAYETATETCLRDFESLIDRLATAWAHDHRTTTQMKLRRFRDQYRDLHSDLRKISRDRQMAAGKSSLRLVAGTRDALAKSEEEGLLRERGQLETSHILIDEAMENALTNREHIGRQNEVFRDLRSRMAGINAMFPRMDSLIGRIGTRKRFESLVLLGTTAFCMLFILWYKCIWGG
ncbi:unnamed protein product [Amoebophrya sp. A25]|nr:unnamed protein product [Amoebophrya sp. A25]|eukprot:GSA25T00011631001.1